MSLEKKLYLPNNSTQIIIRENVISHFNQYIQTSNNGKNESGGQLFSQNPHEKNIIINYITGPYNSDKRTRYNWMPDTKKMSKDRTYLFKEKYYVVGLWHTHPEAHPTSSTKDKKTIEKHLDLLEKTYNGFLLITVGYKGVLIEYLDRKTKKWHRLNELKEQL